MRSLATAPVSPAGEATSKAASATLANVTFAIVNPPRAWFGTRAQAERPAAVRQERPWDNLRAAGFAAARTSGGRRRQFGKASPTPAMVARVAKANVSFAN